MGFEDNRLSRVVALFGNGFFFLYETHVILLRSHVDVVN